ncbi:21184_t:CDS:10, partial [Cetraspora pellucida]
METEPSVKQVDKTSLKIKQYERSRFSNIERVGTGAYKELIRAISENDDMVVALKQVDIKNENELLKEIESLVNVNHHPNIIRFYGITEISPSNYMMMFEFADNGTLCEYLHTKILTWNERFKLAYQIASAIKCLHSHNIVHGNLNSFNTLVHQDNIKICDFGPSKNLINISLNPHFQPTSLMAYKEISHNVPDKKVDIYCIGMLLWELSSGHPPFRNRDAALFVFDFANEVKEEHVPGTPEKYIQIYTDCWQSNRSRRPDITEVANSLKRLMSSNVSVSVNKKIGCRESKRSITEKYSKTKEQVKSYNLIFEREFKTHREINIIINEHSPEIRLEPRTDNNHLQEMQIDLNLTEGVDSKIIAHQSVDDNIQPFNSLFKSVTEVIEKMLTIYASAECSKKICCALLFRVEIAQTYIKNLQRKRQANVKNFRRQDYYLTWVKFTNVLKNIMIFAEEITQLSWFRKFLNVNMVIDTFYANVVEFEDSCYDLDLAAAVYNAEQREKEAQDVAYDILILKKSLDGMESEIKTLTTEIAAFNTAKHSLKNATPDIIASNVPRKLCKIPRINSEELNDVPPSKDNRRGSIMKKIFRGKEVACEKITDKLEPKISIYRGYREKGFVYVNMDETFRWLAPERMKNPIPQYNNQSEMFSFGMLLWELCYQKVPYEGMGLAKILDHIKNKKRETLEIAFHPSPIPRELAKIIKSAWEEDPSSRPLDLELQLKFNELYNKYVFQDNIMLDLEFLRNHNRNSSHLIPQSFNGNAQLRYAFALIEDKRNLNVNEILKYMKMAADRGNSTALYNLGDIYWNGKLKVPVNKTKAELYIKLAALKNQSRAAEFLEKIYKELKKDSVTNEMDIDDSKTIAIFSPTDSDESKTIVISDTIVIDQPENESTNTIKIIEQSANESINTVEAIEQPENESSSTVEMVEVIEQPTNSVEVIEQPTNTVEVIEQLTNPIEVTEQPTNPVEITEQPTNPVEVTEQPTNPVEVTEQPGNESTSTVEIIEVIEQPENESTNPVEVIEQLTNPVEVIEQTTNPVEVIEQPTNTVEVIEQPTNPVEVIEQPTNPVKVIEQLTNPVKVTEQPVNESNNPVEVNEQPEPGNKSTNTVE